MERNKKVQQAIIPQTEYKTNTKLSLADQQWLEDIDQLIREQMGNFNFTINQLMPQLAISKRQFERRLKALTNYTPARYVQEIRFQEARRLLETQQVKTVKDVLYQIGLKDNSHFAKTFKARFGKSPSDYIVK